MSDPIEVIPSEFDGIINQIPLPHHGLLPQLSELIATEVRQGKTGRWTLVLKQDDGKILATSEWGTNYEFAEKEWNDLPLIK